MKWKNTAFAFEDIAQLCKKELEEAGIKTGDIYRVGDKYYYVPWQPRSKKQYMAGLKIICEHID